MAAGTPSSVADGTLTRRGCEAPRAVRKPRGGPVADAGRSEGHRRGDAVLRAGAQAVSAQVRERAVGCERERIGASVQVEAQVAVRGALAPEEHDAVELG